MNTQDRLEVQKLRARHARKAAKKIRLQRQQVAQGWRSDPRQDEHKFSINEKTKNIYFLLERDLILDKIWADLKPPAKAVYPVLGVRRNLRTNMVEKVTVDKIAFLAGISHPKAIKGITELEEGGWIQVLRKAHKTKNGKWMNKYKVHNSRKKKDKAFMLHRVLIDGGTWASLSPVGKALYAVLRSISFFGRPEFHLSKVLGIGRGSVLEDCYDWNDLHYTDSEQPNPLYFSRPFNIIYMAEYTLIDLARLAGIHKTSLQNALDCLGENGLLERWQYEDLRNEVWVIYRYPRKSAENPGPNAPLKISIY